MFDVQSKLLDRLIIQKNGCWIFTGALDTSGYGIVWVDGRNKGAHIVSYEFHCDEVPEGLYVLHRCDNPPCCNPEHLWLGTAKDNYDDMVAKGNVYIRKGEQVNTSKLTAEDVVTIRQLYRQGYSQRDIASAYGVNHSSIGAITRGQNWKHIDG